MRAFLLSLSVLGACGRKPPAPLPIQNPTPAAEASDYAQGLADAMFPLPSEVSDNLIALVPEQAGLQWSDDGRLLVYTWSRSQFYSADYVPGYDFDLYGETWLTTATEVADACAGMEGDDLSLRVEQLLGLPEGGGRDVFLKLWIDPAVLFRPCADPDTATTTCPIASPLEATDDGGVYWSCGDGPHQQWLCETWTERYGASDTGSRYPWTALGYTYDWGNLDDPVGASEFVAPAGTPVTLEAIVDNETFCAE